jgi:hypothetical protein
MSKTCLITLPEFRTTNSGLCHLFAAVYVNSKHQNKMSFFVFVFLRNDQFKDTQSHFFPFRATNQKTKHSTQFNVRAVHIRRSRNDQQYSLTVPFLHSINRLLHVSAVACHHQGAS